jgi:hypothetical protein
VPTLPKEMGRTGLLRTRRSLASSRHFVAERRRERTQAADDRRRVRKGPPGWLAAKELFRASERGRRSHHWVYDEAPLLDALALHARFCDVLVITQPTEKNLTDHPILTLGLPVLQVPNHGEPRKKVGERIMIAWDRSPVALRAVNNARPFLREAAEVKVLSVNLGPSISAVAGSWIIEHLARHDIKATRLRVTGEDSRLM